MPESIHGNFPMRHLVNICRSFAVKAPMSVPALVRMKADSGTTPNNEYDLRCTVVMRAEVVKTLRLSTLHSAGYAREGRAGQSLPRRLTPSHAIIITTALDAINKKGRLVSRRARIFPSEPWNHIGQTNPAPSASYASF